ncbi:helix-turn-helix domain-containing protein [Paludibacteraceae bacterium OttesenSCG-928-F17]|nr:helix-turn-helix domain-containing protein [Paludibacteraceae bacterium OttesenSCG-928-F17]
MKNKTVELNTLGDTPFIELFQLENSEDSIFNNYQRYDFYQLLWFTEIKGNSSYLIDFQEFEIKENQLMLIFPGQVDRLDINGKKGYLFAIHSEIFFQMNQRINSPYLNGYFSNIPIHLTDGVKDILERLMYLFQLEYNDKKRLELLECYMEAILFHLASYFEQDADSLKEFSTDMASLMKLIDYNFIDEQEIDFYAVQLGISKKKLNELSLKGTGKTVKQHLQERLILEIKKEIRLNRKSLKEIAFDLGFNEPSYFTRFFHKHTALTPTQFKESC